MQINKKKAKAVILLSGGADSSTALAIACDQGYECYALSFDYGQTSLAETEAAKKIAACFHVKEHRIFKSNLAQFGHSALTDNNIAVPDHKNDGTIPVTYVPARNTIFFSVALAWAETLGAHDIFAGNCCVDYSGYIDCRPEYLEAYQVMANLATKAAVEGQTTRIRTPLLHLSKAETLLQGTALGVDFSLTVSCYQADGQGLACGRCDSCVIRKKGFADAKIVDPTRYIDV